MPQQGYSLKQAILLGQLAAKTSPPTRCRDDGYHVVIGHGNDVRSDPRARSVGEIGKKDAGAHSLDQHGIAVAVEAVSALYRNLIGVHNNGPACNYPAQSVFILSKTTFQSENPGTKTAPEEVWRAVLYLERLSLGHSSAH